MKRDSTKLTSSISEKALRYNLTVPFARYVVQHQNDIEFPFRDMDPTSLARRSTSKGRFRNFFTMQNVVGSTSL
jgi:histidyl-tRNA synthetase